ncbi:MAG: EAL domain-containing protein [Saccharospirillum sp.]
MKQSSTLTQAGNPKRLDSVRPWQPALLLGLALYGSLWLAQVLSPGDAEAYLFWPVTAFAIAALRFHRYAVVSVVFAYALWAYPLGVAPQWILLQGLTLVGPWLYLRHHKRQTPLDTLTRRRLLDLRNLLVLAVVPASMVGSALLIAQDPSLGWQQSLLVWSVYLVGDASGLVLLMPVLGYWLYRRNESLQWGFLGLALLSLMIPLGLDIMGQAAFAQPSLFLALPAVTWLAHSANRGTLSHALLLLFLGHVGMAYFGLGGYQPMTELHQLVMLNLLLISAFLTADILQATRLDRDTASREVEWLSLHDSRVGALNERGLLAWAKQQTGWNEQAAILIKPVSKDIYLETLSWRQLGDLEAQVMQHIASRLPASATIAKISDLVFVALMPNRSLNAEVLKPLLRLSVALDRTQLAMDCAIAGVLQVSSKMPDNLARLHTLWGLARLQASERLLIAEDEQAVSARKELLLRFQAYREAIERRHLALWLQPIQSLANEQMEKVEVLARLELDGDVVSPGAFLPVFQRFNYLPEFDRHVIRTAFAQLPAWQARSKASRVVNINLSGATLADASLAQWIADQARHYHIDPHSICLEITESDLISDRQVAIDNVQQLRGFGFSIAIDDFGAGLASFEYLNQFQVDVLKLDGQFISDIAENPRHQAIVKAMVEVARSYELQLVAEFVDNQPARDCLKTLGVDYAQGYFIGKPEAASGGV